MRLVLLSSALFLCGVAVADPARLSETVRSFVSVDAPVVALTHVRVLDGTGEPARDDQTIVLAGTTIREIGPSASMKIPAGALVLDKHGETALPGLVGMHDHLFYAQFEESDLMHEIPYSATRLYLASGVTTIRTAGSMNPLVDLNVKKLVDSGQMVGPKMHITGPYLDGKGAWTPQMLELTTPEQVVRNVNYWADEGVTSFKIYAHLPRELARVAIETAHKRGLKVTGHLESLTFHDAIGLGIDNLEHGLPTVTDFDSHKASAACPDDKTGHMSSLAQLDIEAPKVKALIKELVQHHVALTSTLAVWEASLPGQGTRISGRVYDALAPVALTRLLQSKVALDEPSDFTRCYGLWVPVFQRTKVFEKAFVRAGGQLMAGVDPTGDGGVLPGFGDQREIELLVEAGFEPREAIHIATQNGAAFLGEGAHIGTLAAGKQADLVVVHGDPSVHIKDIENVDVVFKDGIGYDSAKLIRSVRGSVGYR